jgi:hypothetical protein
MLVAAELTLAGVPSLRLPDLWPSYYVIAQPLGRKPQRISEVTNFQVWRRLFLIPRTLADAKARRDKPLSKTENGRYWRIDEVSKIFAGNTARLARGRVPHAGKPIRGPSQKRSSVVAIKANHQADGANV